jgi:hypothetical protein
MINLKVTPDELIVNGQFFARASGSYSVRSDGAGKVYITDLVGRTVINGAQYTEWFDPFGRGFISEDQLKVTLAMFLAPNPDPVLDAAILEIYARYGDVVGIDALTRIKFGSKSGLSTSYESIWSQDGIETLPASNVIDNVYSTDNADTQEVIIEGYVLDGADIKAETVTINLTGTTPVILPTPLFRATRIYNNNGVPFAGSACVAEGTYVHVCANPGDDQSLKCAAVTTYNQYWLIKEVVLGTAKSSGNRVCDFKIQSREFGKVFRTKNEGTVSNAASSFVLPFEPVLIINKNSDFRILAESSGNNTRVTASASGYIATIKTTVV